MKHLEHLLLTAPSDGMALSFATRFRKETVEDAVMSVGLYPNNLKKQVCPYLWVALRRLNPWSHIDGDVTADGVHVIGTIYPAYLIKDTENHPDDVYVNILMRHCSEARSICRIREKFVGNFLSFQTPEHATKGGVYGANVLGCEYGGVFRTMTDFYHALKGVYQDL